MGLHMYPIMCPLYTHSLYYPRPLDRTIIPAFLSASIFYQKLNLWKADNVVTAVLIQSFHHQLLAGSQAATALLVAARELCQVTAQQVLKFCTAVLVDISLEPSENEAVPANLTCSIGDILKLSGD